jgi:phosphatidylglycerophosphatase A
MSGFPSDPPAWRVSFQKADPWGKAVLVLSSWFGSGWLPRAPGTFGTLGAVPLALFMKQVGTFFSALIVLIIVVLAVWSAGMSRKLLLRDDPPEVVIDEAAGFVLAVFLLPPSWVYISAGFVLFRIFDILKPFPLRRVERLKGGLGIVLDDLLAGIYTVLCIRICLVVLS